MPYIKMVQKYELENRSSENSGELNWEITSLLTNYIIHKGLSYQTINDIIGALECAKQEFYRRIAVPYEDKKIEENGDVYIV
jgi:hypothetical protein